MTQMEVDTEQYTVAAANACREALRRIAYGPLSSDYRESIRVARATLARLDAQDAFGPAGPEDDFEAGEFDEPSAPPATCRICGSECEPDDTACGECGGSVQ